MTREESQLDVPPTLSVERLTLRIANRIIVSDLSFELVAGETLGIVGESGSGKTMTAHAIAGLLADDVQMETAAIRLEGRELSNLSTAERRALAGSRIGMVLQERLGSFNPVRTIGSLMIESAMRHRGISNERARALSVDRLSRVRLRDAEKLIDAYPHQLSGGQLQRAMIALAQLNDPVLLIADEPTTALDPVVQLQVLALLRSTARQRGLLLITHDVTMAAALCDRLLVMHQGLRVEQGNTKSIIARPQHAYTRHLLATLTPQDDDSACGLRSVSNL